MIGTSKIRLPIIADREVYFYAMAINRLQVNGSLLIFSKTIHNDKRAQAKYKVSFPK